MIPVGSGSLMIKAPALPLLLISVNALVGTDPAQAVR
jgi:hypothetical protein